MTMLVSLREARNHLRVDDDCDDDDITLKIKAASEAVLDYIGADWPWLVDGAPLKDAAGDPICSFRVKAAVLFFVGEMYLNRESSQGGEVPTQWGYGYLPRPVIAMLYSMRDPAVA